MPSINGTQVFEQNDSLVWTSKLEVDVDGAPTAYAPADSGLVTLDDLQNAGHPGDWWGIVCNEFGIPYVQQDGDPNPGYYVSSTALADHTKTVLDPRRYVDASEIPYLVVPKKVGYLLGNLAFVHYNGTLSAAIVADIGPHLGEGSFALHKALGVDPQRALPHHHLVGIDDPVEFVIFYRSMSTPPWPRSLEDINDIGSGFFMGWGGVDRLNSILNPS